MLRAAFTTAALDAGVRLRDVEFAARHADPRTATVYDRRRENFDRHAAYAVVAYVTSGSATPALSSTDCPNMTARNAPPDSPGTPAHERFVEGRSGATRVVEHSFLGTHIRCVSSRQIGDDVARCAEARLATGERTSAALLHHRRSVRPHETPTRSVAQEVRAWQTGTSGDASNGRRRGFPES